MNLKSYDGYCNDNYFRGLSNRINTLVSDMRIAKEYYNTDLYIKWFKFKYEFNDLFDMNVNMFNEHKKNNI